MHILIIGYGKMGQTIEKIAISRNHKITICTNVQELQHNLIHADIAIEFTRPDSAFENLKLCFENNVPVVCGTTGWLDLLPKIYNICIEHQSAMIYSSNFSIGVNLFFKLNKYLAALMQNHTDYQPNITEIHHTEKRDAPSGTAISIAEGFLENNSNKKEWVNNSEKLESQQLNIVSIREPHVPGTHTVDYESEFDNISITHQAYNRQGFGLGAVLAAEWLVGKKGIYTMNDMLGF